MINICYNLYVLACMAELVDAIDSKSIFTSGVPVQVRIQAPKKQIKVPAMGLFYLVYNYLLNNFNFNFTLTLHNQI